MMKVCQNKVKINKGISRALKKTKKATIFKKRIVFSIQTKNKT